MPGLGIYTPGLPLAGEEPNTLPLTGNERVAVDTCLPEGMEPQSEAVTTGQLFEFVRGNATNVMFYGATGDGIADDSAAVNDANAAYNINTTVTGSSGVPGTSQGAGVYFPSGQYKCPTGTLGGTGNGWQVFGDGVASAIIGGSITLNARLSYAKDLSMWGINFAGTAVTIGSTTAPTFFRMVDNVAIRGYNIGLLVTGTGALDTVSNVQIASCNTGIEIDNTTGINFSDVEVNSTRGTSILVNGSGEIKCSNLRALAGGIVTGGGTGSLVGATNLHLFGQSRSIVLENYWTNLTATGAGKRVNNITSCADNGSGGTRFYTSVLYNYTSIQAQNGAFVPSPYLPGVYECQVSVLAAPGTSSITSVLAGGTTELLTSPVVGTGNTITTAVALAAAINAGTPRHGYTASTTPVQSSVWIQAPDGSAAFFRTLVVTTAGVGASVITEAFTWLDLGAQHDFVVGEDIALTNYTIGVVATNGFATIFNCPSDSAPQVIPGHTNSHILAIRAPYSASTGTACRPNRLSVGLTGGNLFCTGYTSGAGITISAVDNYYFEASNIPFAGVTNPPGSNYMNIDGWDVFIDAYDSSTRVADQFFTGGNINYLLIRSGFNCQFWGTRIKTQFWIDPRLNPGERSDRILWAASGRSLGKTPPFGSLRPDGATTGWFSLLINDLDPTPGNSRFTLIAPTGTAGVWNEIGVTEQGLYASGAFLSPPLLPSYAKAALPSASPAGQVAFCTDATGGATIVVSNGSAWKTGAGGVP